LLKLGGKDASARAGEICANRRADYQQPPIEDVIRSELEEYVSPVAPSSATSSFIAPPD